MATIYPNKITEFSFEPSLLQGVEVPLDEGFVADFNAAREHYRSLQRRLEQLYGEYGGVDGGC